MGSNLLYNYFEATAVIVFGIGFTMLFFNRNMVKKVIGFNFIRYRHEKQPETD